MAFNSISLTRLAASVAASMKAEAPAQAEEAIAHVEALVRRFSVSGSAQRVLIFNPDAVGQWLYERYTQDFLPVTARTQLAMPMLAAFPPVTPVCFATMYTGTAPSVHGIRKYEKPVVKTDSLFDALTRSGKRVALVAVKDSSMALIFTGKKIDYYLEADDESAVKRGLELIKADRHDFICVYVEAYDDSIHETEPESPASYQALKDHMRQFAELSDAAEAAWAKYDTLTVFAPDHGIHKAIYGVGDHFADIPEDMNMLHFYGFQPANQPAK
ncbi:MAG: alkaline phosphatase family protein [Clostridiaceae bacterium]